MIKTAVAVLALAAIFPNPVGCAEMLYPNPLSQVDMADPSILRSGDLLYGYSTGLTTDGGAYPISTTPASDPTSWTQVGSIFAPGNLPTWAARHFSNYWAPEVHQIQGRYVCYFSVRKEGAHYCIGAGTASGPEGPFTPLPEPLVTNPRVGVIDAGYYQDPATSRSFLLWKDDNNDLRPQEPTGLFMQELEPDGLSLKGEPGKLIENDRPWEGELVEAPSIIYRNSWYYLIYSGNVFSDERYGVGVARSKKVDGPYVKFEGNPILHSNDRFSGPGHQFPFKDAPGKWIMFYHARDSKRESSRKGARLLMSDPILWNKDGWPTIRDGVPSEGWNGWGKTDVSDETSR